MAVLDFTAPVTGLHADGGIGFSMEYDEILKYSMNSMSATHEHSSHPGDKHENRARGNLTISTPTISTASSSSKSTWAP